MTSRLLTITLLTLAGCQGSPSSPAPKPKPEPEPLGPVVEVKNKVIETGIEDTAKTYDYPFTVANAGDQPLELKLIKKSCSCTEVEAPQEPIEPGKSAKVVFHWSPLPTTSPAYTSYAELQTNDRRTPLVRLELKARVHPLIRFSPSHPFLDFLTLRPGKPGELTLKVFSTKLSAFDLEAAASPALAIAQEKLAKDALVEETRASCGYELTLKTTDKVPPNYFRDDLVLMVKVPNQEPRTFKLPVYANLETGDFSIVPTQVEFRKPQVTEDDSKKVIVRFLAPSEKDAVEVVKAEPSFLTTTPPEKVGKGEWRFEVKLPRGNAEAAKFQPDGFFEGRIVLKISGAAGEVPVRVKWAP